MCLCLPCVYEGCVDRRVSVIVSFVYLCTFLCFCIAYVKVLQDYSISSLMLFMAILSIYINLSLCLDACIYHLSFSFR